MIKIIAKNYISSNHIEEFLELAQNLVNASREESGCLSYTLYQDIKEANVFVFIEEWKDELSIAAHNKTEHFTTIVPKLQELCYKDGEVNLYQEIWR